MKTKLRKRCLDIQLLPSHIVARRQYEGALKSLQTLIRVIRLERRSLSSHTLEISWIGLSLSRREKRSGAIRKENPGRKKPSASTLVYKTSTSFLAPMLNSKRLQNACFRDLLRMH